MRDPCASLASNGKEQQRIQKPIRMTSTEAETQRTNIPLYFLAHYHRDRDANWKALTEFTERHIIYT